MAGVYLAYLLAGAATFTKTVDKSITLSGLTLLVMAFSAFRLLSWVEGLVKAPKARLPFERPFPANGEAKEAKRTEVDGP
jgi:hypothetical protein